MYRTLNASYVANQRRFAFDWSWLICTLRATRFQWMTANSLFFRFFMVLLAFQLINRNKWLTLSTDLILIWKKEWQMTHECATTMKFTSLDIHLSGILWKQNKLDFNRWKCKQILKLILFRVFFLERNWTIHLLNWKHCFDYLREWRNSKITSRSKALVAIVIWKYESFVQLHIRSTFLIFCPFEQLFCLLSTFTWFLVETVLFVICFYESKYIWKILCE